MQMPESYREGRAAVGSSVPESVVLPLRNAPNPMVCLSLQRDCKPNAVGDDDDQL